MSMMYAVPLSTGQQQQQNLNNNEPSSSSSTSSDQSWPTGGGGAGQSSPSNSSSSQQAPGPWGSVLPSSSGGNGNNSSTMSDITNKQQQLPSNNNAPSGAPAAADWSSPPSASSTSVWQTAGGGGSGSPNSNEPGDKNSWNAAASSGKLASSGSIGGGGGQDKENQPVTPTSMGERSPLEVMIYRQGWGQVEVKQEVPWTVPESPPPVHEDPSMWKPKANTGTEVWEKSTGHRTQPWQNQAPNTPRWISGDERDDGVGPNSVWNGGGAPGGNQMLSSSTASNSGPSGLSSNGIGMMSGMNSIGSSSMGLGGNSILSSGPVSQVGRPNWNSSGPGSGGSGGSSGGNISPTGNNGGGGGGQWNDNVQDQEWSEWRDPSSVIKRENVNGTDLWGGGGQSSSQQQQQQPPIRPSNSSSLYGGSSGGGGPISSMNSDPRNKSQDDQRPRGWQDAAGYVGGGPSSGSGGGSQMQQQQQQQLRSSSDWSSGGGGGNNNENEWRGPDSENKQPSSRSQWAQRPPSPPNNAARYTREQIYQSKQYQGLLEMGFKREDIDAAMRNNNMHYDATLTELKRRRGDQMQQRQMDQQRMQGGLSGGGGPNSGFGPGGVAGVGMMNGGMQQQMQQQQKAGYRGPVPNIHALAQQLSVAAKQGIINPRLLNQPLAPQTTGLLHKLMQQHRALQGLSAQHELLSIAMQKTSNPSLQQQQQQQLNQFVAHIQQTKKEIFTYQKQIDVIQNEFAKSPTDPRFQGGDLSGSNTSSSIMSPPAFSNDFHSAQATSAGSYNPGWRMPDPTNMYGNSNNNSSPLGGGMGGAGGSSDSWGMAPNNFMSPNAFTSPQMMGGGGGAPMWNDPSQNQWGMHTGGGGMNNWRGMAPTGQQSNGMEDWSGHMNSMKSPGGPGGSGDVLSPSRGNGSTGFGMDDSDGGNWGGNRQGSAATFANPNSNNSNNNSNNSTFSTFAWETLPEFEPGKPWRGSQLLSADDDPHLTPGSVQNKQNPLMNAVTSSGGGGGGGHYNAAGDSQ
ncbi:hypothetical protein BV898_18674 [Hypsibius exemplaris]|uniref:GW182 middle domain-containing protein n=1 Tax=Hypsibius exemplaris TaxID=2072580 RepID=A0A9X6NQJ7_HYPEX|nr:hypothetical protein BV898_18674 [Hypsibius exemplaris]